MSVGTDNLAYRKGLLLGMTMAEIVILIIFLLLLAFAALLEKERKSHEAQDRLMGKNKTLIERIIRVVDAQDPAITEELVKAFEALPNIISLVKKSDLAKSKDETIDKTITQMVEKAAAEKSVTSEGEGKSPEERLAEALQAKSTLEAENQNLRDQKDNLVSQMKSEGRGVDSPPCWSDAVKNPEFIFKVDLTSSGIVIHDNPIPERAEEKSRLPLQDIKFDTLRNVAQFRAETNKLYELSKQKECRFFVLLYDKTATNDKVTFKHLLRTVEEHFYKKLVDSTPSDTIRYSAPPKKEGKTFFDRLFKKNEKSSKEMYN